MPHLPALNRRSVLAGLAGAGTAGLLGTVPAQAATAAATGHSCTITVTARPAAESERLRLAQALRGSEFHATGLYAPPGAEVTLSVLPYDDLVPTLWIGLWDYYGTLTEPRAHALKPGANTVVDPHGGPVYLTLAGDGERAGSGSVPGPCPCPRTHWAAPPRPTTRPGWTRSPTSLMWS